ncbi:MAG: GAF domain-containing protein [Methylococcaceae bacterium]
MNITLARSKFLTSRTTAWLETLALTVVLPVIGYGANTTDPFYLNGQFPWLVFAPLLISLRYGFLFGMSSASLLITMFALCQYLNWGIVTVFPKEMVVGMMLITMISAEFHDSWQQKLKPLQHKYHHLKLRMNDFSRTYHILKGSHSQLEQQTANYTKSMRTSLLDLQKKILTLAKNEGEPLSGIGDQILDLFSEYGSIQTASVYAVSKDQEISLSPVACLGNPPPFWATNILVREALKTGCVTSIQPYDDKEEMNQEILVVIPLVDVFQKVRGMVIVNEMPMFALQENTLDMLSLLGGHIGDLIKRRTETNLLNKDARMDFEYELRRVLKEVHSFKIGAAMVVRISNCVETHDLFISRFRSEFRGLDKALSFMDDFGRQIIINLLPLTDENGLHDFLSRLDLLPSIDNRTLRGFDEGSAYHALNGDLTIYSWILNDTHSPEKVLSKIAQLCQSNQPTNRNGDYSRADISA